MNLYYSRLHFRGYLITSVYPSVSQPFFHSRHPSIVLQQFGGTPSYNLLVNMCQFQNLVAPLELFTAPKGAAAPRLRTTGLDHITNLKKMKNSQEQRFSN